MKMVKILASILLIMSILVVDVCATAHDNNLEAAEVPAEESTDDLSANFVTIQNNVMEYTYESNTTSHIVPMFRSSLLTNHDFSISCEYKFYIADECDYATITYLHTDGIEMISPSQIVETSNVESFVTEFNIAPTVGISENETFFDIQEENIIVNVAFWYGQEKVAQDCTNIWILATPFGTFVSETDSIVNKRNYSRYLLNNGIINSNEYERLSAILHRTNNTIESELSIRKHRLLPQTHP